MSWPRDLRTLAAILLGIVLFFFLVYVPVSAMAQRPGGMQCISYIEAEHVLQSRYGERAVASWPSQDGSLVFELWGATTGTYTVLALPANMPDMACIVGDGEGFQFLGEPGVGKPLEES